jgi:hypothetical protein
MQLTEELKKELEKLYRDTPDNIHGVSLGYKYKNSLKTDQMGIVFDVERKLSESDLSDDQILPKTINIGDQEYITDVKETPRAEMLACYCSADPCPTDPNISRLQPAGSGTAALFPMRGGQEIIEFPTNWTPTGGDMYSVALGTLGFFCVDNIDNKIVGVTNSHVVCNRRAFASERDWSLENSNFYNTAEPRAWVVNGGNYNPGALTADIGGNTIVAKYIKRYQPVSISSYSYSDVALLAMAPSVISSTASYKVWQPIGTTDYTSFLTFASTEEIDNLLTTNPRVYSTGRTTGPKGYTNTSTCRLRVTGVGVYLTVSAPEPPVSDWADLIAFDYENGSAGAILGGDSGSALLADISGVRKIIGICFAGNGTTGWASRIDRVATEMNIRAWDGTYDTSLPTTLSGVVTDLSNSKSSQASLVYGGKTYYQAGFTKTTGLPQVN